WFARWKKAVKDRTSQTISSSPSPRTISAARSRSAGSSSAAARLHRRRNSSTRANTASPASSRITCPSISPSRFTCSERGREIPVPSDSTRSPLQRLICTRGRVDEECSARSGTARPRVSPRPELRETAPGDPLAARVGVQLQEAPVGGDRGGGVPLREADLAEVGVRDGPPGVVAKDPLQLPRGLVHL